MALKLIKLSETYREQLGEMIDEWKADQEANHTDGSPWAIFRNDYHDFAYYLAHLEIKKPADGLVPDSVFFLLDEERNRLLGAVNIRHELNEFLLREGGHIGDGIRPSERRKGYATELIRLALKECERLGIEQVLITCDKDNIGSAKSILYNGGVLENEVVNSEGKTMQRYWIDLRKDHSNNNELYLELKDEEWPFEGIDHDRRIVRAITVDEEGYYWFVRAERDDEFGKAVLIETSGGGVEEGETLTEAIRRELREELGAEVEILSYLGMVSDYYNLIHRHNINHYFFCRITSFGAKHLTEDEISCFHLSALRLRYEEAVAEYEKRRNTAIGRLIAARELPVLKHAERVLNGMKRG